MGCNSSANKEEHSTIHLVGQANKTVMPDRAVFTINISSSAKSEAQAVSKLKETSNEILQRLKGEGFQENQIKLTNYDINIETDYFKGVERKIGYNATEGFTLKFPIDKQKIFKTYESLTDSNIKNVEVSYASQCSDSLKKGVQNELIILALKDAKEKAETIALHSDSKITSLLNVTYKVSSDMSESSDIAANVQYSRPMVSHQNVSFPSTYFSIDGQEFEEEVNVTYNIEK
jgi:uncharacterized protein YggE